MYETIPDNPYLLLTPGPLSTSKGVRNALLRDWCTWDADYNTDIVQNIRHRLVEMAASRPHDYTVVMMQGSGSFSIEATLGSVVGIDDKLLIITNGAYGTRMVEMAEILDINHVVYELSETQAPELLHIADLLDQDEDITHVAIVHCETTTGMLNPLERIAREVKAQDRILIVDAMSSFGGIPLDMYELGIDFLVSSSNKCIQGVPGFGFVIAKRSELLRCEGNAHSLCLDLFDQWQTMKGSGKWRYTSPTHCVRAFYQALSELDDEGGIEARHSRYCNNQRILVEGMDDLGYKTLLPRHYQSPIITSFLYLDDDFDFSDFYHAAKKRGFVLYPGKISQADTFRIGTIGDVYPADIERLLDVVDEIS
ncbi:MAG: 2-aminoethylphosphonate--pyruvate transaminase [Coriobacteriia bacterium]|nr:2-aminoethylphosphonate--pyruvate transaminase [Coriobacteriia bacterium]